MTREEAIDYIKNIKDHYDCCYEEDALDMAIEALSAEPCEDCITLRLEKGALKYSDKDYVVYKKEWLKKWWQPELALLGIELPSIQPIRPKGEWEYINDGTFTKMKCTCGYEQTVVDGFADNYCPNCGADMKGDTE